MPEEPATFAAGFLRGFRLVAFFRGGASFLAGFEVITSPGPVGNLSGASVLGHRAGVRLVSADHAFAGSVFDDFDLVTHDRLSSA